MAFWAAVPADTGYPAGDRIACTLCHHRCVLRPGQTGLCRVRANVDGRMSLPLEGAVSAIAIDPIEKKPLYRFMPGTRTFSVGYVGCNLRCPFCQNSHISQTVEVDVVRMSPEDLVARAIRSTCPSVSHTYSEPLVHAEFVAECMERSSAAGLRSVLVTNGSAGPEAAAAVLAWCDAVNVDLKAWDADFYRHELGGDRDEVLRFIEQAVASGVHTEVTTLVIPGKNDDDDQIRAIASFLAGIDADIVLHLSAYRPMYRYSVHSTPASTIERLVLVASEFLHYVYAGNLPRNL